MCFLLTYARDANALLRMLRDGGYAKERLEGTCSGCAGRGRTLA